MLEISIHNLRYVKARTFRFTLFSAKSLISQGKWVKSEGANDFFPFDVLDIVLQLAVRKLYGKNTFFIASQDSPCIGRVFKPAGKDNAGSVAVTGDVEVSYRIRGRHANEKSARGEVSHLLDLAAKETVYK